MANADVRLTFTKVGRAKYISHLDVIRTMTRAFKRAGIPIWYTQGFHPHPYMMFPLALSLGVESRVELMDIKLSNQMDFNEIKDRLNKQLPDDIQIVNVVVPEKKHTEIAKAEYDVRIKTTSSPEGLKNKFLQFLNQEKIEVEKRTKKKGLQTIDIKPYIEVKNIECREDEIEFLLTLPAGCNANINTSLVTEAFEKNCSEEFEGVYVQRTKILTVDNEIFA